MREGRDDLQVAVNTTYKDENAFLDHIVSSTNMKCLTPPGVRLGDCGFLAANLYAKSVFGEDALVNVSVEKQPDGRLAGFIRIRYCQSLPPCLHQPLLLDPSSLVHINVEDGLQSSG